MNCFICYSEVKESIKCNADCSIDLCQDCFGLLLEYSNNNKLLPLCQNTNCHSEYYYSNIKTNKHVDKYLDNLVYTLNNNNKDEVSKNLIKDKMYKEIQEQRKKYIMQFPHSINLIIDLALSSKMKKINKTNQLLVEQNQITKKSCFNILCKGSLDSRYHCYLCGCQYCNNCEMKKEDNHKCNKIDLDSLDIISNMIKCPKCLIPIEKSEGCNDMTCSSCQTNFCYRTGEIIKHGNNHNVKININSNKVELLSNLYQDKYNDTIINKIIEIENLKFTTNSKDIINILKDDKINTDNKLKIKLAKKYEKLKYNQNKNILYYKSIIMIDDLHKNNKLNLNVLNKIYENLIA